MYRRETRCLRIKGQDLMKSLSRIEHLILEAMTPPSSTTISPSLSKEARRTQTGSRTRDHFQIQETKFSLNIKNQRKLPAR